MARPRDFAGFELKEFATLLSGEGDRYVSLSCVVVAISREELHLALRSQPDAVDCIAPGTVVRVRRGDAGSVRAQVISLDLDTIPVVVVRALAAVSIGVASNQRSFHRVPTQLQETHATAFSAGRAVRFRVRVVDLSGGGARVMSPQALAAGDLLSLRLPLPDGSDSLELRSRVMWVRPIRRSWQAGLQFTELSNRQRDQIVRAVFMAEIRLRKAG